MVGTDATHCPLCIGSLIGPAQQALAGAHTYLGNPISKLDLIDSRFFSDSAKFAVEEETKQCSDVAAIFTTSWC